MVDFIVDNAGKPSQTLLQLLDLCKVKHNSTLQSIVAATQIAWVAALRSHNKERWEIEKSAKEKFIPYTQQAMPLLCKLGLCNERVPTKHRYDYAIIFGSDLQGICLRLAYFLKALRSNITFNQIVILTGERSLSSYETRDEFVTQFKKIFSINVNEDSIREFPKSEPSLIKCIITHLNLPSQLQSKMIFIATFQHTGTRPTTADCVKTWVTREPVAGSILAFSDQPYCIYQDVVLKSIVPCTFFIETVGCAAQSHEDITVFLDTLARILFQENERLLQRKNI